MENIYEGGMITKETIDYYLEMVEANTKKIFIDKFGQDYIFYKKTQKKGKKVLVKLFELQCDMMHVDYLITPDVRFQCNEDADKLLVMAEKLFVQQKERIQKSHQENHLKQLKTVQRLVLPSPTKERY